MTALPAAPPAHVVSSHGLSVRVPAGWHGAAAADDCDPTERLRLSSPRGRVVVLVLEDHVNKPVGDLRRPARFHVAWDRLTRLEGCCRTPSGPGYLRWFKERGRLLGFLVHPRGSPPALVRAQTDALLDSLRVAPSAQ